MLRWALILFVVSLIAGVLGFSGIEHATRGLAKVLFFLALIGFIIVVIVALMLGKMVF